MGKDAKVTQKNQEIPKKKQFEFVEDSKKISNVNKYMMDVVKKELDDFEKVYIHRKEEGKKGSLVTNWAKDLAFSTIKNTPKKLEDKIM